MDVHPIMEVLEVLPFWPNEMKSMTYRGTRVPQSNIEYKSKQIRILFECQVDFPGVLMELSKNLGASLTTVPAPLFTPSAHDGTLTL